MSTAASPLFLPSRYWADYTTADFAHWKASGQAQQVVAVLPVAAIEQHGPHLPLSVDATLLQGVIDAAIAQLPPHVPALFLPPQNIGLSTEHAGFAGTLTLDPATVIALWTQLGACVARSGVRKLLIFNSHGGNVSVMDIVARELRQHHGLLTYSASWFSLPQPEAVKQLFSAHEHRFGIHGGDVETSMMLHLAPRTVHMDAAQNFHSTSQDRAQQYPVLGNGYSAKMGWAIEDYNSAGAVGHAAHAHADKGRLVVENAGVQLSVLLEELSRLPYF